MNPKIKQLTANFQKRLLTCRQQRVLRERRIAKDRQWALAVDTARVIRPISKILCFHKEI